MSLETELANHDWPSLQHMYGSAADIPDTLRAAKSADKATRDKAVRYLYDAVTHQDDYESASPHVAAALVALITEPDVPDRPALLKFFGHLVGIATCYDVCGGDVHDDMFGQRHRRYGIATYHVGVAALPTLMNLASGPQATMRTHTIAVLKRFPTKTTTIKPFLDERMVVEDSEQVRAMIVDVYRELLDDTEAVQAAHDNDPSLLVRTMAACHLAWQKIGGEAVAATLIAAMENPEIPIRGDQRLPLEETLPMYELGNLLRRLAPNDPHTQLEFRPWQYEQEQARIDERMAFQSLMDGDARTAMARLAEPAEKLPRDPFRLSYLALATSRATGTVADVTDQFPDFSLGWHHRSLVHRETGDLDEARRAADRAIELGCDEGPYFANRAALRALAGDLDGALADARTAVDRDPGCLRSLESDPDLAPIQERLR